MNSFEETCNEAVTRFIKTVAIIDDEATYDLNLPSQNDKDKQKPLKPPVTGMMGKRSVESSTSDADKMEASTQKDNDISSQLDAKAVINAFADMGIICCIQRPEIEDHPFKRAIRLAASVDVLVIDWVLNKKRRLLSRDIIKKILEEDKRAGHRMRLIIVYTSHNYIDSMLQDIEKEANKVYANDPLMKNRKLQTNGSWLLKNNWMRIVILNKEITFNPLPEARIVPFDKLPEIIISESSEMMKGIIPSATLHGIAAVREKTHTLLSILNSKLDGAYCFHRALIPEPSDSVDFAMNLVTNEIETIIKTDLLARKVVDEKVLKAWFEQHADQRTKIPCYGSSLSVETIEKFILNGHLCDKECKRTVKNEFDNNRVQLKDDAGNTLPRPPLDFMNFREVLYSTQKDAINGCYELSNLQCTAMDTGGRLYDGKSQNPALHMGTILKKTKGSSSEWFLCLTPLCDSVRLEEELNFLFLQLYPGVDDKADVIIKNQDGTFETLMFKQKKIRIVTIPFSPKNGSKKIDAHLWRKEWRVKSKTTSYQWIGELRYSKALSIAHHVATNSSRVGIDEFEWLRLKATIQ